MSRFMESEPCKQQAKILKSLGFTTLETDDSTAAVWQQGFIIISLPAGYAPHDAAEVLRRVATLTYEQGLNEARRQVRQALGLQ